MIINKNIENDTYLKLVHYAFQKCDSIFLIKRNDRHKLNTSKIMEIIMQTNQYSENDIIDKYLENPEKFIEEIIEQFIDNDTIFEEDDWKEKLMNLGMSSEKIEELKVNNRFHMIEGSIMQFVYETLTKHWVNKNKDSIIKTIDYYITEPSGDKFLYENVYYINLTKEIKQEILNKSSIFDWCFPMALEDLCFFKDGYCWLYSVAHEEILDIYCENEEEFNYLKSIGVKFRFHHFIPLSEGEREKLYYTEFENYG